jgi:hypothetical protein
MSRQAVRGVRAVACALATLAAGAVPGVAFAQEASSDAAAAGAAGVVGLLVTMLSSFMCLFYAAAIVIGIGSTVLWVVALVDLVQRADSEFPSAMAGRPSANEKTVWLLVILFAGAIGAVVYYLTIMRKVPRGRGQ